MFQQRKVTEMLNAPHQQSQSVNVADAESAHMGNRSFA